MPSPTIITSNVYFVSLNIFIMALKKLIIPLYSSNLPTNKIVLCFLMYFFIFGGLSTQLSKTCLETFLCNVSSNQYSIPLPS